MKSKAATGKANRGKLTATAAQQLGMGIRRADGTEGVLVYPSTLQSLRGGYTSYLYQSGDVEIDPPAGAQPTHGGYHYSTGSDPEVFALDANGIVIPAWKYLKSKKENPSVFYDGFQAELTTLAGSCHDGQCGAIRAGLLAIRKAARAFDPKATLSSKCVVEIPRSMMLEARDEHAMLGCAPSLNIYGDVPELNIEAPRDLGIRFAGCHIHQGTKVRYQPAVERVIKMLDNIVGVGLTSLLDGLEDPRRRRFYGKAGEYRLPAHGFEYRVPSSAVLCSPTIVYLTLDLVRAVAHYGLVGGSWKATEAETREAIDQLDVKLARKLLKRNKDTLTVFLERLYGYYSTEAGAFAYEAIMGGAKELIETEMEKTWNFSAAPFSGMRVRDVGPAIMSSRARAAKAA